MKKKFLHIGCGRKFKNMTTAAFNTDDWDEVRLDIDPNVQPDIVCSMLDMNSIEDQSFDALYSSHNIEHLYPYQVATALNEFKRVLKPEGFLIMTCPDLQAACEKIVEGKLLDPLYQSPGGPVTPLDILYGLRPSLAKGNHYMAHHCGFTQKVLTDMLHTHGFAKVAAMRRGIGGWDIWALASVALRSDEEMKDLALRHFPSM